MLTALLLSAATFVGPPEPRPPADAVAVAAPRGVLAPAPGWAVPLALYCGGAAADLITTEVGLARGGRELNPLLRTRGVRIPAKLSLCVLAAHRDRAAQRQGSVKKRRIVAGAIMAAQLAWNIRQIRRLGREGR